MGRVSNRGKFAVEILCKIFMLMYDLSEFAVSISCLNNVFFSD